MNADLLTQATYRKPENEVTIKWDKYLGEYRADISVSYFRGNTDHTYLRYYLGTGKTMEEAVSVLNEKIGTDDYNTRYLTFEELQLG